jgi:hypothetical protein
MEEVQKGCKEGEGTLASSEPSQDQVYHTASSKAPKFKYGYEIPRNYEHALFLD